ncbi:hypothetical protein G7Y89_g15849 [Cudoniella acicularis]|uniref:Uncharacterized protein n=1 Tax=Cudoniella acicularis TaxID=354080 RepID=A0A8H4QF98_9HELO|nr:hypothetical protein G7Y89_g15849 [Cudoniella acicularis]
MDVLDIITETVDGLLGSRTIGGSLKLRGRLISASISSFKKPAYPKRSADNLDELRLLSVRGWEINKLTCQFDTIDDIKGKDTGLMLQTPIFCVPCDLDFNLLDGFRSRITIEGLIIRSTGAKGTFQRIGFFSYGEVIGEHTFDVEDLDTDYKGDSGSSSLIKGVGEDFYHYYDNKPLLDLKSLLSDDDIEDEIDRVKLFGNFVFTIV